MSDQGHRTALDIARGASLTPITTVAREIGITEDLLQPYGEFVAKIKLDAVEALANRPRARYVVVTAITPTPLGEGKTTTTLGLAQGMRHVGRRATAAIRQASMGPTFGIKGGAAGGGYSQAAPFEALNLHLTGDMHAVTAAHNTLSAMVDNHLYQGNELDLDPSTITWRRALDVNDRALRNIVIGLGSREDGVPRQAGFDITAASEVMAILALSTSLQDMRRRLGQIVVGFTPDGAPVTAEQLRAAGAMTVIMRDAIQPNLLQTLENTPVLVHAGPFGNIAHGNSSVIADLIGIHTGDYLITEAGFGADMGAERFFNIKCRVSGLVPDAAVIVTTVRALKAHSGAHRIVAGRPLPESLLQENPDEVHAGGTNLRKQIENVRLHGVTPVVAINAFPEDFESEYAAIAEIADSLGVRSAVSTHFRDGGAGATELAEAVVAAADEPSQFRFLYPSEATLREKIETIATQVYGADGVDYLPAAARQSRPVRGQRTRWLSPLHRQDPPLHLLESDAQGSADPMAATGPRGPGLSRCRLHLCHLRRYADDARTGSPPGGRGDRHRRERGRGRALLRSPVGTHRAVRTPDRWTGRPPRPVHAWRSSAGGPRHAVLARPVSRERVLTGKIVVAAQFSLAAVLRWLVSSPGWRTSDGIRWPCSTSSTPPCAPPASPHVPSDGGACSADPRDAPGVTGPAADQVASGSAAFSTSTRRSDSGSRRFRGTSFKRTTAITAPTPTKIPASRKERRNPPLSALAVDWPADFSAAVCSVATVPRMARPSAPAICMETLTIPEPIPASAMGTSAMAIERRGMNEVPAPTPMSRKAGARCR